MKNRRPNLLLITTDQMRRDHLGCYGNAAIRTPHLDALAAGGVAFTRSYVSNPVCMPNRATIATGRLPRNHRTWSNGISLDERERTVAHCLAEEGYHTALLGKGHLARAGGEPVGPLYDSAKAWQSGLITPEWTGPYYGFEECRLAIGHGNWGRRHGHYGAWLEENFPGVSERAEKNARHSPIGAPQCFTPDMPAESHASSWLGGLTEDYLRGRARDGRPFFCWTSFPDPHHPFCPPAPYDTMYDPGEVVMPRFGAETLADKPDYYRRAYAGGEQWEGIMKHYHLSDITEPQLREIIARTYGMISLIDDNVGRILRVLDETGLASDTVVVFTADHGDLMGDCGLVFKGPFLLEGLVNIPMIWRLPAGARADAAALMNSCDIAPTFLELAGAAIPPAMDGVSQASVLRGDAQSARDAAFVEFKSMYHQELNLRVVVTAERKLVHYAGQRQGELYDLTAPVPEARNLHDDPAFAADRAALERRLLDEEILRQDRSCLPLSHA